jgi:hypothetical protein
VTEKEHWLYVSGQGSLEKVRKREVSRLAAGARLEPRTTGFRDPWSESILRSVATPANTAAASRRIAPHFAPIVSGIEKCGANGLRLSVTVGPVAPHFAFVAKAPRSVASAADGAVPVGCGPADRVWAGGLGQVRHAGLSRPGWARWRLRGCLSAGRSAGGQPTNGLRLLLGYLKETSGSHATPHPRPLRLKVRRMAPNS